MADTTLQYLLSQYRKVVARRERALTRNVYSEATKRMHDTACRAAKRDLLKHVERLIKGKDEQRAGARILKFHRNRGA